MKLITYLQLKKNLCSLNPNKVQGGILFLHKFAEAHTHTHTAFPRLPPHSAPKFLFHLLFKTSLSCIIGLLIFGIYGAEMYAYKDNLCHVVLYYRMRAMSKFTPLNKFKGDKRVPVSVKGGAWEYLGKQRRRRLC